MKSRKFSLPIMLIIMALIVVACGGDDDSSDDGDSDNNINLSQNVTFDTSGSITADNNMMISIDYPDGWVADVDEEYGELSLMNSQEVADALTDGNTSLTGDQLFGNIFYEDDANLTERTGNDDPSLIDIITLFVAPIDENDNSEFGDIEEITVGDVNLVYVTGTIPMFDTDVMGSVAIIITEVEGGAMIGILGTEEGEIEQYEDEIKAIFASVSVTPIEE